MSLSPNRRPPAGPPLLRHPEPNRRAPTNRPSRRKQARRVDTYSASATYARRTRRPLNPGLCILFAVMALLVAVSVIVLSSQTTSAPPAQTVPGNVKPPLTQPSVMSVRVPTETMHTGPLILVNYRYAYTFPADVRIVSVNANKSNWYITWFEYSLEQTTLNAFNRLIDDFYAATGCGRTLMNSGFRTFEEQAEIFASSAVGYATEPGHSEHHTGLALDIQIYDPNWGDGRKKSWYFNEYDDAAWLISHFADYGFILRYPEGKANLTMIEHEAWHYRYIGAPHAAICNALNDCLEEYIEYLETTSFETRRLWWDGETARIISAAEPLPASGYLVYYVPASDTSVTEIPLPAGQTNYRISGDNVGGFVVTLTLG